LAMTECPLEYHLTYWKAEVFDFVILQQDAFDKIDCNAPMVRQKYMLEKVYEVYYTEFNFDFEEVNPYLQKHHQSLEADELFGL
jgi:V/A-type H+/Na+-transporting ATPase subunit A